MRMKWGACEIVDKDKRHFVHAPTIQSTLTLINLRIVGRQARSAHFSFISLSNAAQLSVSYSSINWAAYKEIEKEKCSLFLYYFLGPTQPFLEHSWCWATENKRKRDSLRSQFLFSFTSFFLHGPDLKFVLAGPWEKRRQRKKKRKKNRDSASEFTRSVVEDPNSGHRNPGQGHCREQRQR